MSSTDSVSSNCLAFISLPEPQNLTANFFYEKYSPNETLVSSDGCKVEINFSSPSDLGGLLTADTSAVASQDVSNLPDKVHTAGDLLFNKSSQTMIRDSGVLERAYESFDRSCRLRSITGNSTDRSVKLAADLALSGTVLATSDILTDIAVNYAAQSLNFFSADQVIKSDKFSEAGGIPISAVVNDRIIYDLLQISEREQQSKALVSLGLLANDSLLERQRKEREVGPKISYLEMDCIFNPVYIGGPFRDQRVAIQIMRTELTTDGSTISETLTLPADATSYIDRNVKYGSRYTYSARAVYRLQIEDVEPIDGGGFSTREIGVFIASTPSNLATVTTVEKVPPPYPADVSFRFDYQRSELSVRWEFPVNRVQDITRFQVFRRSSIREPFLLLKELDFDKSEFKISRPDEPLPVNVSKSDFPVRSYVDRDFGRSSTYIYAVAAVDAHGYVSNYSAQYEVKFDTRTRGLQVRCISPAGAPRPYPNMYYSERAPLVEDTITRSKVSSINFVFDPEYLRVVDRDRNDLNLIRFAGDGASYYLNVIDTVRAEQVSIPISIRRDTSTSAFEASRSARLRAALSS